MNRQQRTHRRDGNILVFVVILLFGLLGLTALVVDLGLVRLTQLRLQNVSDAASLEGTWALPEDLASGSSMRARMAAAGRAAQSTEFDPFNLTTAAEEPDLGLGPREVILTGGVDLNNDGANDAGRLITIGDRVAASLNLNEDNSEGGDIVVGAYDPESDALDVLPPAAGAPNPFDRSPTFTLDGSDPDDAVLVRLRRTGSTDVNVPGATTGGRLPLLFGTFAQFGPGNASEATTLLAEGFAVRSESIARLFPATAVGAPGSATGISDGATEDQIAELERGEPLAQQIDDLIDNGSLPEDALIVLPSAISLAISVEDWGGLFAADMPDSDGADSVAATPAIFEITIGDSDPDSPDSGPPLPFAFGAAASLSAISPALDFPRQTGYISIVDTEGPTAGRIVAFGLVQVTTTIDDDSGDTVFDVQLLTEKLLAAGLDEMPFVGNASADLSVAMASIFGSGMNKEQLGSLMELREQLPAIVMAPRMVRANRIQEDN